MQSFFFLAGCEMYQLYKAAALATGTKILMSKL